MQPQPGDHIYSERKGGLYTHHGIYVGNDRVIHLMAPSKQSDSSVPECQHCGYKGDRNGGIVKTCLDCFLDGHSLYIYEYGVSIFVYNTKRRGTCSPSNSKPADEVIRTATDFLRRNRFGNYDVFVNNCEDFAVYCKTGSALSHQVLGHVENVGGNILLPAAVALPHIARGEPSSLPHLARAARMARVGGIFGIVGVTVPLAFGLAKVITEAQRRR